MCLEVAQNSFQHYFKYFKFEHRVPFQRAGIIMKGTEDCFKILYTVV